MVTPIFRKLRDYALVTSSLVPMFAAQVAMSEPLAKNDTNTVSPIKHVIVIIGENRTFDHVFGTYIPKSGQSVFNLLSEKIVTINGTPGPNFSKASRFSQPAQNKASDTTVYDLAPAGKTAYKTLPAPGASGSPTAASNADGPPFQTLEFAANYEYGLYPGQLALITTGASGLSGTHVPDTRITRDATLPNGPFQITGAKMPYDSYTGSPVHRFYQMWQQEDCSTAHATTANPTGCLADLFPYVETTIDAGNNGNPPPTGYKPATYQSTEGATAMGFFNMAKGDVPYFKQLADDYTISDNFHQSVMGAPAPTISCSATPMGSTTATRRATRRHRRPGRSRIRTRRRAPTTTGSMTATARPRRWTAAPIRIVPMLRKTA